MPSFERSYTRGDVARIAALAARMTVPMLGKRDVELIVTRTLTRFDESQEEADDGEAGK